MKIENIMKMLEVFWPIAIAIYGFFIYKFIPYMKTKIFINEYHNFEVSFFLMEYELVGTIVAQVLVIFLIVAFGKSTWSNIIINEYFFALSVIGLIYSFGISLIVKLKTEKQKKKYVVNMFFGIVVYFVISMQGLAILKNLYNKQYDRDIYFVVISCIILQVLANIKAEKVRNVKYIVITQKETYKTLFEPVKRGKYYFIRITDKNGVEKKRVQIAEERIEKIEYIIEKVEEHE